DAPLHFFTVFRMNQFDPVVATEDLCARSIVGTDGVFIHLFNLIALQEPLINHKLPPATPKRGDDVASALSSLYSLYSLSSLSLKMVSLTLVSHVDCR